jgi:hypothetical protein
MSEANALAPPRRRPAKPPDRNAWKARRADYLADWGRLDTIDEEVRRGILPTTARRRRRTSPARTAPQGTTVPRKPPGVETERGHR